MIRKIVIFLMLIAISGCSSVASIFDSTKLIWSTNQNIEVAITPPQFVVSVKEVKSLIDPQQKFQWYIYADSNNYYIVETQNLVPGFRINSQIARKNGIEIYAKSREAYLFVVNSLGSRKHYSFQQLKSILKSKT